VKIIRPIKDISYEELQNYTEINHLEQPKTQSVLGNSLQSVIHNFVNDLQDHFPSTISTVCKTADKIGNQDINKSPKCEFCEVRILIFSLDWYI
jgi:tRNA(Ile)-lysidine synthase TilS/MesJ